jgi:hypothetical protein
MVGEPLLNKMAQTALDRMDEYLGMKDGPERDFKQSLKDRRDESIGATESDLVDRLFKSVQDAFSPGSESGRTMSDRDLRTLSDQDLSGRTLSDADLAIGRTISDQDLVISRPQLIRDEIEQGRYGLSKGRTFSDNDWGAVLQGADPAALLSEKGDTISDRDRAIISGLLSGVRVPPIEIKETSEVITESPEGAIALDETMQLPSAMELARMGMGLGSRKTPPLQEGLGGFGFQPHQLPAPERLSPYEEMLMLASLGIPGAALGGRAVGGLMRGMKGRPTLPQSPSAMRDMGPQTGNITAAAHALNPIRSLPGITGRKGLESLKQFMGRENLRRPQVSKMAGAKFVDPDHKKVFTRAFGGPKDNTMYMWSDDAADYFKDSITRKTFKVPRKGSLADDLHDYPQW